MSNRRDFLKLLGIGGLAAGASAFAGRAIADNGAEVIKQPVEPKQDVPKQDQPLNVQLELPMLRLAQAPSQWARLGKVHAGNWFTHEYGATECLDLGPRLNVNSARCIGMKAMQFKEAKLGVLPMEVHTDPNSPEFQRIVEDADNPMYTGAIWGPVWLINAEYLGSRIINGTACIRRWHGQYELFLHSKTLRRFAFQNLGMGDTMKYFVLGTKQVTTRHFSWWMPEILPEPA